MYTFIFSAQLLNGCAFNNPDINKNPVITDDVDSDGITEEDGDCNDNDATIYPQADDTVGDEIDQNCDGIDGVDFDQDGFASDDSGGDDCNDLTDEIHPNATETYYDGVDQNCDGLDDYDADEDGYPSIDFDGTDCNDEDASIYPQAEDDPTDGIDSDCDGTNESDQDEDGIVLDDDCDDSDASLGSIDDDSDCDGILTDDDCDDNDESSTTKENDADCDGVLSSEDCDDNDNSITNTNLGDADCDGISSSEDCDDNDNSVVNTNTNDADCDGISTNDDCDDNDSSTINTNINDTDCDGISSSEDCDDNDNSVVNTNTNDSDCDGISTNDDCDDNDGNAGQIEEEICDGFDNDCDGDLDEGFTVEWFQDIDGDGYGDTNNNITSCTPSDEYVDNDLDCDDTNVFISPDATEICDGLDNDCDGSIDQSPTPNNTPPSSDVPTISSSLGNDAFGGDLIADVASTSDPDGDSVVLNYDWRQQGQSIAALNMSFDTTSLCGVTDYSTHQNHGVINGSPTYDSGFKGQAMSFDDSVGSIEIENANLMSQSFTFSAWIYVEDSTNPEPIFSQSSPSSTFLNEHFLFVEGGHLRFQSYHSSPNWTTVVSSETIPNQTWVHVAMTREGNSVILYVNGVPDYNEIVFQNIPNGNNYIGSEGKNSGYENRYFQGKIDEVLVFDHVIKEDQILSLYNSGIPNNTIVFSGTDPSDNWEVAATPSDSYSDGTTQVSGIFEFQCADDDADCDGIPSSQDCDDNDINAGQIEEEICDGLDNDCDGTFDEGFTVEWFQDSDGDGFGDINSGMMTCHPEIGFVDNNEDCDDGDEFVSPNGTEICDGIDNDCDGSIDQSPTPNNAPPSSDVPTISSSLGNDAFLGDLIADVASTSDPDGDNVVLNYDWRQQGQSIAALNMSFDTTSLCGVTDYSTHQNHGVINGSPTYDSGFKGQAMSFDGSLGSYIEIENSNLLSSNFSISTWINTSTTGKVQGIISQSPASSTLRNEHFLFVGTDNKLKFQSHDSSSNQWPTIVHPTVLSTTDWIHVAMTQSGDTITLFVNGIPSTSSSGFPAIPDGSVFIGSEGASSGGDGNRNFDGKIDELIIYSHALSDAQIAALYNNGVPSNQTVVTEETTNVDQWMVAVTPNDGLLDGTTEYSEEFSFDCAGNDADCDGYDSSVDCNDANPSQPATDADCDDVPTEYDCDDNDTTLGAFQSDFDCDGVVVGEDCDDEDDSLGSRYEDFDCDASLLTEDCDDEDPKAYPGAAENESSTLCMRDADEDGFGDSNPSNSDVFAGTDCNDDNASILDEDCDGDGVLSIDDGGYDCDDYNASVTEIVVGYEDLDQDTLGNPNNSQEFCGPIDYGYVGNALDCHDQYADIGANCSCTYTGEQIAFQGKVYVCSMDDLSWDEAQGYCDSLNVFSDEDLVYTIVRPSTEAETEWLELISDNAATDSSWIGATSASPIPSDVDSEDGWYWDNSQTTPEDIWGLSNWDSCQGANYNPFYCPFVSNGNLIEDDCAFVTDGEWYDHNCSTAINSLTLCEAQPVDCDINYCYLDDDNDGYGDANEVYGTCGSCDSGYVQNDLDCDDNSSSISPIANELWNSGVDEDCDGLTDEKEPYQDRDGDGYSELQGDCHDGNSYVYPGQTSYFSSPYNLDVEQSDTVQFGTPKSFDYNCDGVDSKRWTSNWTCSNSNSSGWYDSSDPDCPYIVGVQSPWVEDNDGWSQFNPWSDDFGCGVVSYRSQQCR